MNGKKSAQLTSIIEHRICRTNSKHVWPEKLASDFLRNPRRWFPSHVDDGGRNPTTHHPAAAGKTELRIPSILVLSNQANEGKSTSMLLDVDQSIVGTTDSSQVSDPWASVIITRRAPARCIGRTPIAGRRRITTRASWWTTSYPVGVWGGDALRRRSELRHWHRQLGCWTGGCVRGTKAEKPMPYCELQKHLGS